MKTPLHVTAPVRPSVSEVDHDRAARAIRELLSALGENPDREGLRDTPRRVAALFATLVSGRHQGAEDILSRTFEESFGELVLIRDIELSSTCEHHLLPFVGAAHIAYLPGVHVVGLSKLARLVDAFAHRLQVQERLTRQVADAVMEHLAPAGVLVAVQAEHFCMRLRGVRKSRATTWTIAARGALRDDRRARDEAMALIRSEG